MNNELSFADSHLQRLTRLGNISRCQHSQEAKGLNIKESRQYSMTMQQAMDIYMHQMTLMVTPDMIYQNEKAIHSRPDSDSLICRMSVVEIYRVDHQKEHDADEPKRDHKKKDGSEIFSIGEIENGEDGLQTESSFDKLDVNRSAGFLLYSYDKRGGHSILGRDVSPGYYGGRITSGDFIRKA